MYMYTCILSLLAVVPAKQVLYNVYVYGNVHVCTCTCILTVYRTPRNVDMTNVQFLYYVHVREMKKEGRKKQARSNKQQGKATQHTQLQGSHFSKEK